MKRSRTSSFVCEFEVETTSGSRRVFRSRLEAGRQLFNAVLGEALHRLSRVRTDPRWSEARTMAKGTAAERKERSAAFRTVRRDHGFEEYELHKHPSLEASSWLRGHLDINTAQKVASRAFAAVDRHAYGQAGRPRFKRYGELESLEGKSDSFGIRLRDRRVLWSGDFGTLDLPLRVREGDPIQALALSCPVKYTRLLRRVIRGQERVFAQLVVGGAPLQKHDVGADRVAVDLGPSKVAIVTGAGEVLSRPFCPGLDRKAAAKRRYQRRMDRQRRANNPGNYDEEGRARKGPKVWKTSRRQRGTNDKILELDRALAAQRKSLQGQLANEVLALGNRVVAEKVSVRAWQRQWGRSVGHKAPGAFQAALERKAHASGGSFEVISTAKTFLSSRCLCGKREKKPLAIRRHECGCVFVPEGTWADRDEFSAFLALHCAGDMLDEQAARTFWYAWGADRLLRSSSGDVQAAKQRPSADAGLADRPWSGSIAMGAGQRREAETRSSARRAPRLIRLPHRTLTQGPPAVAVGTPGL